MQGYDFACAVAVDRSLRCWSFDGIEKAPDGAFTSVAVGHDAACGLRTDKTLHCWNPENLGEAVATTPGGKFPSVEVAFRYACGRRIDGSLECWAMGERVADPPAGAYGVRVDGALECWTTRVQESPFGRVDPPEGTFVEVSVNDNYGCALGSDSRAVCWGRGSIGRDDPPDVGFSQISVGGSYTCGVRDSGELVCWGDIAVSAPVGSFSQVSLGAEHGCALGADGSLTCWTWRAGGHPGADLAPQTGRYTQVSVRGVASCALDSDGAPVCWGEFVIDLYFEPLRTWHVPVTQLDSGSESLCRLNSNGRMTCGVGFSPYWASPLIDERGISAIAVGDRHACGLRDDGTLACWGRSRTTSDVPAGEFSQVDATRSTTCALRVDGEPVCWGPGAVSTIEAPAGEFVAVAAAGERGHPCGIRIDGTIECWGPAAAGDVPDWTESLIDASVGAQVACAIRADASVACWVPGTGEEFTGLEGNFAQLASSEFGLPYCGVRTDGSLACSGLGIPGAGLEPPQGEFIDLTVGHEHACGIRVDGSIECWGSNAETFIKPTSIDRE